MNTDELKDKLKQAKDVAQVTEIMKANGQEVSAEDAERILQEIQHYTQDAKLSVDELEAVSGGWDHDWLTDGCAATVEPQSWCGSNDKCVIWDVTYSNEPKATCSCCGGFIYEFDAPFFKCKSCGKLFRKTEEKDYISHCSVSHTVYELVTY